MIMDMEGPEEPQLSHKGAFEFLHSVQKCIEAARAFAL